jgi:hypothetical protein
MPNILEPADIPERTVARLNIEADRSGEQNPFETEI